MYPPKVPDKDVQALIRDLSVEGEVPSGAAVRAALAQRYGSRGGVARVYRLLQEERVRQSNAAPSALRHTLMELENRTLHEQLGHAQQRQEAHQAYWEREVGKLSHRLRELQSLMQHRAPDETFTPPLSEQVGAAETRASQLEVQVRIFGPAAKRAELPD